VVIGLPAVPALDAGWDLGADAASFERERWPAEERTDDRLDHRSGAPSGGRRKRGTQRQGFGRSKGGFTTKIHLRTNAEGLPIAAEITGGEVSDYKGYDLVMDADAPAPKVLIADKGYDADRIREQTEANGGVAVIPMRRGRKNQTPIDDHIYALRNRIERCFNKLKNARRLATRYDKTAASYLGFIHIVSVRLWTRHFVNVA
jgi:transposase